MTRTLTHWTLRAQFPLTYVGIHALDGNFTIINIAQMVVLLPLFVFCFFMYKWEREELVPIRCVCVWCKTLHDAAASAPSLLASPAPPLLALPSPLEGEELPTDPVGPRTRRRLQFLA